MLDQLGQIISHYGALGVFLAAFTEEVIVPIPSAIVMLLSGFFLLGAEPVTASSLLALFFLAALPIAAGLTIGSLVTYGLAYRFGKPLVERWGKYLTISWQDVEKLERRFESGWTDEAVIFGLRLVPLIPSVVINVFSGLTRFPLVKYCVLTFCGVIIRAYFIAFIGWQLGGAYYHYGRYFGQFENLGLLIVVVILAALFWRRRQSQRKVL